MIITITATGPAIMAVDRITMAADPIMAAAIIVTITLTRV